MSDPASHKDEIAQPPAEVREQSLWLRMQAPTTDVLQAIYEQLDHRYVRLAQAIRVTCRRLSKLPLIKKYNIYAWDAALIYAVDDGGVNPTPPRAWEEYGLNVCNSAHMEILLGPDRSLAHTVFCGHLDATCRYRNSTPQWAGMEWRRDGLLHRQRYAARVDRRATEWWLNGVRHRVGAPAFINVDGRREWWRNGKLHRDDGPAVTYGAACEWWKDGQRHRDDGPAIETPTLREWWVRGQRHREDGFAIEFASGRGERWLQGRACEAPGFAPPASDTR